MKTISKSILLLSMALISSSKAMEENNKILKLKEASVFSPSNLGKINIYHDNKGYHVVKGEEIFDIENHSLDPLLSTMKHKQLKKFQKVGYIDVKEISKNEFKLSSKVRGPGGGAGGATAGFWIGRFATQTVGYGIVAIAALPAMVGGPVAYSVAVAGLAGTCAPLIESASHAVAIGTAITVGVATGPA